MDKEDKTAGGKLNRARCKTWYHKAFCSSGKWAEGMEDPGIFFFLLKLLEFFVLHCLDSKYSVDFGR